jgi:hypothetical protein
VLVPRGQTGSEPVTDPTRPGVAAQPSSAVIDSMSGPGHTSGVIHARPKPASSPPVESAGIVVEIEPLTPPPEPRVLAAAAVAPAPAPAAEPARATKTVVVAKEPAPAPPAPAPAAAPEPAAPTPIVPETSGSTKSKRHRAKTDSTEPRFSADEEAFFAAGQELARQKPTAGESFDDLDAEYDVPTTFWKRFMRRPEAPLRKKPPTKPPGSR